MSPISIPHNSAKFPGFVTAGSVLIPINSSRNDQEQPNQLTCELIHEVRNPLSTINMALAMLRSITSNDEERKYLDIIMRSTSRINHLVDDLLISAKPGDGNREICSIHHLLNSVFAITEDGFLLKDILVIKDYTTLDDKLSVDPKQIKVALTNIIINAIDAMPSGKGKLRLATKSLDGKFVIEIEDNGIGISKESIKTIFDPYISNKSGGMGLGLSASLNILRSHHAEIDVQSEEGIGTKFTLSFAKN